MIESDGAGRGGGTSGEKKQQLNKHHNIIINS